MTNPVAAKSNLLGIGYILLGAGSFVLNDSLMKLILTELPAMEILVLRGAFGAASLLPMLAYAGQLAALPAADAPLPLLSFQSAMDLALATDGQLYVADKTDTFMGAPLLTPGQAPGIWRVDPDSGQVTLVAGVRGAPAGAVGPVDGQGSEATFNMIRGLCAASDGNLYVEDVPLGIRQAIGTELHEVEDLATKGVADRLGPLRTTVFEDVVQQRGDDLVLVATIALNQSRHRNRVRDVRQWQAKSVLGPRAIAPSCHNPKQLGAKFVNRRSQHALGLDARLARRVEPQQVHHDVANDGEVVGGIAAAHP